MPKNYQNRKQLFALKYFAKKSLSNVALLPIIVQRNKLKAKKIGQNFLLPRDGLMNIIKIFNSHNYGCFCFTFSIFPLPIFNNQY